MNRSLVRTGKNFIQALAQHAFIEPEHQVVFESIHALFPRGPISVAQLRIHLNNRGFPDTDVDEIFSASRELEISSTGRQTK